jgi:MFS family permease
LDSYRFYLAARSTYALCWATIVTVNLVFMVEVAKLDPLQMVLVGTVLELSVFLFEIPTGVVADRVSRRLSVVIGHGLMGVGFFVIVLVPEFWMILVSQIIWGLGWTFISGAYPAWLTSEIGVARANEAILRASQLAQGVAFLGIGLSIALAHVSLALPIAVGSLGLVGLSIVMCLVMREAHFQLAASDRYLRFSGAGGPGYRRLVGGDRSGGESGWTCCNHPCPAACGSGRAAPAHPGAGRVSAGDRRCRSSSRESDRLLLGSRLFLAGRRLAQCL